MNNQSDDKRLTVRDWRDLDLLEEAVAPVDDAEHFHAAMDCPRLEGRSFEPVDQQQVAADRLWPCPDCHDRDWVLIAGSESLGGRETVFHTRPCTSAPINSTRTAQWVPQDELRDTRRECKRCISEPHGQLHPQITCPLCGENTRDDGRPIRRLPDHLPECDGR